jgi:hypothetical protein
LPPFPVSLPPSDLPSLRLPLAALAAAGIGGDVLVAVRAVQQRGEHGGGAVQPEAGGAAGDEHPQQLALAEFGEQVHVVRQRDQQEIGVFRRGGGAPGLAVVHLVAHVHPLALLEGHGRVEHRHVPGEVGADLEGQHHAALIFGGGDAIAEGAGVVVRIDVHVPAAHVERLDLPRERRARRQQRPCGEHQREKPHALHHNPPLRRPPRPLTPAIPFRIAAKAGPA